MHRSVRLSIGIPTVLLVQLLSLPAHAQQPYSHQISNGDMTVQILDLWGGAITDILVRFNQVMRRNNVDNTGGPGRQIEASLYNGVWDPNCWPCNSGCFWGYNPVQAGNACGSGSGADVLEQTATRIVTRTQPLQWNNALGRSNVIVDQTLELVDAKVLKIEYRITNNESFAIGVDGVLHELPVVYLSTAFDQPVCYQGPNPFTHDPAITDLNIGMPHHLFSTTEPWVMWRDSRENYWGLALYVPGKMTNWSVNRLENTSFMQAWEGMMLNSGQQGTLTAYILAGDINEIRSKVYAMEGR